jgi:hypothetical protein
MSITLPENMALNTNPNGIIAREAGVQIIMMNFALNSDSNLQEQIAFFQTNGYAFVQKPVCDLSNIVIPDPSAQNQLVSYETREISSSLYSFNI